MKKEKYTVEYKIPKLMYEAKYVIDQLYSHFECKMVRIMSLLDLGEI